MSKKRGEDFPWLKDWEAEDEPVETHRWIEAIRCARVEKALHHVAVTIAWYADRDGTRVFPGIDQLTVETGLARRTVMDCVVLLARLGFLRKMRSGRGRTQADEYRLTVPQNLPDDEFNRTYFQFVAEVERLRDSHRNTRYKGRVRAPQAHVPEANEPDSSCGQPVDGTVDNDPEPDPYVLLGDTYADDEEQTVRDPEEHQTEGVRDPGPHAYVSLRSPHLPLPVEPTDHSIGDDSVEITVVDGPPDQDPESIDQHEPEPPPSGEYRPRHSATITPETRRALEGDTKSRLRLIKGGAAKPEAAAS